MTEQIDGPRLASLSGETKQLVIFLHGYGADGADLLSLGQVWQRLMPDAAFVAPDAPQSCDMSPMGFQWFPLRVTMQGVQSSPKERWDGAQSAAPVINGFIDKELEKAGLEDSHLALVGFSQGAMMALHVGLRRKKQMASIVSYSGMLLGADEHLDSIVSRPPVFAAHGSMDEVVPFASLELTRAALQKAGVKVTHYVEPGIGHGIDGDAVDLAGGFIRAQFETSQ